MGVYSCLSPAMDIYDGVLITGLNLGCARFLGQEIFPESSQERKIFFQTDWYFESGATSHTTSNSSTLSHVLPPRYPFPSSIVVGDSFILLPGHWRYIPSWSFVS